MARILPLGLLAAFAAAVVAGCGGATLDPVAQAATKTADAGSFRFAFSVSLGLAGGQDAAAISGDGAYDGDASRLLARLGVDGQNVEVIVDLSDDAAVYVKPPAGEAGLPAGKTWAKVDLAEAAKAGGVDLGPLSQEQLDPHELARVLEQAGESTKVGEETIDGVETTHYRVVVDGTKAVEQQPKEQREQARKALEMFGGAGIPLDVWVDGNDLLRRVSLELGGKDAFFSIGMRLDFSDYGSDVSVELPPADQVVEGPALLPKKTS